MMVGWCRADYVHPPHLKWPGRGCRVKISWCLMDKITMDLTGVTSFGISDGIRDHLRPIISQSSESIPKLRTRLMSSTHAIMRFFEYFLCLLFVTDSGGGSHPVIGDTVFALSHYSRIYGLSFQWQPPIWDHQVGYHTMHSRCKGIANP